MWTKVTLDSDAESNGQWKALQDGFEAIFLASGGKATAAMYVEREPNTLAVTFYFSPTASDLMRGPIARYAGAPCDCPASEDVTLLVGDDRARDTAFATSRG